VHFGLDSGFLGSSVGLRFTQSFVVDDLLGVRISILFPFVLVFYLLHHAIPNVVCHQDNFGGQQSN
jgi:hypothetical protein